MRDPQRGVGAVRRLRGGVPDARTRAGRSSFASREPQRHVQRERELEQHERDLLALAAPLEDRQQLAVVRDRLVERVLLARPVAGAREVRDRLVLVLGAEPVVREQAGDLVLAAGVRLLEPLGGLAVQTVARPRATSVRYAASWISACLKRNSGSGHRRPSRTRSSRCSSVSAIADLAGSRPATPSSSGRPNCRPSTDAAISASCAVGSRRSMRARITFSTVGGISTGDLVVEPPAALVVVHERARVGERAHELLQEERVALGRLEDPLLDVGRQRAGADERVQELAAGVARQRVERELARAVRQLAAHVLLQPPRAVVALGPRGDDEQQGRRVGVAGQPLQELERRGVGPVQVLDRDRDGAVGGEAREQGAHHLERAVLEGLGRELREAGLDVGLQREPEQRAEVRVDVGRALAEQLVDLPAERDAHPELGLVGQDAEPRAQQVPERPVRHRLAVGDAAALEPSGRGRAPARRPRRPRAAPRGAGSCRSRARP